MDTYRARLPRTFRDQSPGQLDLPWLMRIVGSVTKVFHQTPAHYADIAVWQHTSDEWKGKSWSFFDHNRKQVVPDKHVLNDDVLRADVWAKMLELGGEKDGK